jgi:hypothetical protein
MSGTISFPAGTEGQVFSANNTNWLFHNNRWVNANTQGAFMPIAGVTDGSDAAAGQVGEYVYTSGHIGVGNIVSDLTQAYSSIALSAGDWEVTGWCWLTNDSNAMNAIQIGLTTTSGFSDVPTTLEMGYYTVTAAPALASAFSDVGLTVPDARFSLNSAATVYVFGHVSFGAGTTAANTAMWARRVR